MVVYLAMSHIRMYTVIAVVLYTYMYNYNVKMHAHTLHGTHDLYAYNTIYCHLCILSSRNTCTCVLMVESNMKATV